MPSTVVLSGNDYDVERTSHRFFVPTLTSANLDAGLTDITTVQGAINDVSHIDHNGKSVKVVDTQASGAAAAKAGQREVKWRVSYSDDVDPIGNGSFEIGGADLDLLGGAGSGDLDTSAGAGLALVTQIEAKLVSRLGNAITVVSIKHVGRNI